MNSSNQEIVDIGFDVEGFTLPAAYPFGLWDTLKNLAPELEKEKLVGVLPLRATHEKDELLLSRRSKLVLRLPKTISEQIAAQLRGKTIQLGANSLTLGNFKIRSIESYPTLHAQLVSSDANENLFLEWVQAQLAEMNVTANLICGKRGAIGGEQSIIPGYSLVVHDLKPEASLKLQYFGLGRHRQFGCGIFVPHKEISGLSED